jgi:hypothetical protein
MNDALWVLAGAAVIGAIISPLFVPGRGAENAKPKTTETGGAANGRPRRRRRVGRPFQVVNQALQVRVRRLTGDQIAVFRDTYNALGFRVPLEYLTRADVHVYGLFVRGSSDLRGGFVIGYRLPWRALGWPVDTAEGNAFRVNAAGVRISCEIGCVFIARGVRNEVHRNLLWGAVLWFAQRAGGSILFSSHTEALWSRYKQVLGRVIAEYHGEVLVDGVTRHENAAVIIARHPGLRAYSRMLRVRRLLGRG